MSASNTNTPSSTAAVPMPKKSFSGPLSKVTSLGDAFEHPEFKARLAASVPKHVSGDRMLSVFLQAVRKTPKLAQADLMSFLGACVGLASVGLEPNTPLGHAYLIPFDENKWNPKTRQREFVRTNVQVIFGYKGLLDLAFRSDRVQSIHADVVWKADVESGGFDFHYGTGSKLFHRPSAGAQRPENEKPLWAYMHANMKGGAEAFEVMPVSEVYAIRDGSQGFKAALAAHAGALEKGWKIPAAYTESPWVKFETAMIRKTVVRAGTKWLPQSIELAAAVQWDEMQDRGRPNYGAIIDGGIDVLNGGLDALSDESGGEVIDFGASDAAFSTQQSRGEPETVGRGGERMPEQRQQQAKPQPTQRSTSTPTPEPSTFIGYLVDNTGEMQPNAAGDDDWTDPVAFARALEKLWKDAPVEERADILVNNADGITEARRANGTASSIIRDLEKATASGTTGAPDASAGYAPVPVPQNGRGSAWPPYVKALREDLAGVTAVRFAEWLDANLPTIKTVPDAQRLMIAKAVSEAATRLGLGVPASVNALIAPAASKPSEDAAAPAAGSDDRDEKWADDTIEQMRSMNTLAELRDFGGNVAIKTIMARLDREKPELYHKINLASSEILERLNAPKPQHEQDDGPDSAPYDA